MQKDVMFRGCTRPAMFLGVPYVPFFMGAGGCLMLAMYTDLFFLFLIPVVIFVMRTMAKRDEMIFRLLGLRVQFTTRIRNRRFNNGMWVFSPNLYRKPGSTSQPRKR